MLQARPQHFPGVSRTVQKGHDGGVLHIGSMRPEPERAIKLTTQMTWRPGVRCARGPAAGSCGRSVHSDREHARSQRTPPPPREWPQARAETVQAVCPPKSLIPGVGLSVGSTGAMKRAQMCWRSARGSSRRRSSERAPTTASRVRVGKSAISRGAQSDSALASLTRGSDARRAVQSNGPSESRPSKQNPAGNIPDAEVGAGVFCTRR